MHRISRRTKRDAPSRLSAFTGYQTKTHISRPIARVHPTYHKTVKRGVRPLSDTRNIPVFHWVVVDIIDVPRVISFIANGMFPKAPLPDGTLRPQRAKQGPSWPWLSWRATRTAERRSVIGNALAKAVLISRQRVEKSASPSGKVQRQCR